MSESKKYDNNSKNNKQGRIAYTLNLIDTFPNAASNVLKIIFAVFDVAVMCARHVFRIHSIHAQQRISRLYNVCAYQNRFVRIHCGQAANDLRLCAHIVSSMGEKCE